MISLAMAKHVGINFIIILFGGFFFVVGDGGGGLH